MIFYVILFVFYRLIREGLCDRGSAPSISAISRLLRGHDGDDSASEKKVSDGKFLSFKNILYSLFTQYAYYFYGGNYTYIKYTRLRYDIIIIIKDMIPIGN